MAYHNSEALLEVHGDLPNALPADLDQGYAEWRAGAGERARQRAEAKQQAERQSRGGSALRRASQQLAAAFRRASASMTRAPNQKNTARVAVEL